MLNVYEVIRFGASVQVEADVAYTERSGALVLAVGEAPSWDAVRIFAPGAWVHVRRLDEKTSPRAAANPVAGQWSGR